MGMGECEIGVGDGKWENGGMRVEEWRMEEWEMVVGEWTFGSTIGW